MSKHPLPHAPRKLETCRGLPELAGICSVAEACRPGLSVTDCVARLKRYHYALQRLFGIFNARLTAEPVYELKMAFGHHAYLCSEMIDWIRDRVAEMRHPPLGLEKVPDDNLRVYFDEIRHAPETADLLAGIYGHAVPALRQGIERHLAETNLLADQPSVRILRRAADDLRAMAAYGEAALEAWKPERDEKAPEHSEWTGLLHRLLAAAGGLHGADAPLGDAADLAPRYSASPIPYERLKTPQRDERFPDPYNMGVHAEEFLYDDRFAAPAKTLMMYYKRLREIDVPEMMASLMVEFDDKPWEFFRDMARQLWDEGRHAMMGEVGFAWLGIDWPKYVMVNFTWSKGLNEQLTPRERHAVLWFIEQGLMTKTGKRFEWEVGRESGDRLAELFQDYDWADEVLHARIGREWYVNTFDSIEAASTYGSECWSKVVSDWKQWQKDGLTEHRNWWPDLYRRFCELRGKAPDPETLAFRETYAESRADLQRISASG